jgi:hypothetical protein
MRKKLAGESSPPSKVLTGRGRTWALGLRAGVFGSPIVADQPAKGDGVNMSRFIQRLLDRKNRPVNRSNQRPRLQVELLEDRLTPCMACPNLTLSHVLDVTSAPIALARPDAGPLVAIFADGAVRLASNG